eukprot:scaffold84517_cov55-Phaeocystis_antarctica.AAC.4
MATSDFAREMRTRVKLDTQGLLELSVSYEPLTASYSPLQPLTAPYSPLQLLTGGGGVQPVGAAAPGQGRGPRARARRQRPQAIERHDQGTTCSLLHGVLQDGKYDNSAPYLKLFHGEEQQRRTETHAPSLDPIWDETFEFDGKGVEGGRQTIEELLSTELELECYDENKAFGINMLANNPLIGTATVDLKP